MESSRLRAIKKCAVEAGVKLQSVEQHKKHVHIILENGRKVITSITPSDWRGEKNLTRDLRKYGAA
jgi:hypothetical protein